MESVDPTSLGCTPTAVDAHSPPRPDAASALAHRNRATAPVPAIEMIDVRKSLGRTRILRGVSFGVPRGSITALIGPSGAGKTTCLRHIVGLMAPDRGDVLVDGSSIYSMAAGELATTRRRMSVMFQDGALFGSLNVFDNVAFALRQLGGLSEPQIGARAHERLRQVGLDGCDDLLPDQLSTGMRKRLALARALARDAEIFVLDDLDTGLDGVRLDALCRLIREFQERAGATYLVNHTRHGCSPPAG